MGNLNVNEEQCIGCGACVAIDPEHFDFNENGLSSVIKNDNLESANLKSAMESCPTGAISIGDKFDNNDSINNENKLADDENKSCNCCENCTGDDECNCGCKNCECGK